MLLPKLFAPLSETASLVRGRLEITLQAAVR